MKSKITQHWHRIPKTGAILFLKQLSQMKVFPSQSFVLPKTTAENYYYTEKKMMAILVGTLLGYMAIYANFLISKTWNLNSDGKLSQQEANLGTIYYINKIHLGELPGMPDWYFSCFPALVLSIMIQANSSLLNGGL